MAFIKNDGVQIDPLNPVYSTGKKLKTIIADCTTANSGDVVILATGLSKTAIIRGIRFPQGTSALAGNSDVDFGFYKLNGDVIDKDALADGVSFTSAVATSYDVLGKNVAGFEREKNVGDFTQVDPIGGVMLCATFNTGSDNGALVCEIIVED